MAEALVIRLLPTAIDAAEQQAQWMLVDTSGSRLGAVAQGNLSSAGGLARGRQTLVLVPGADVLLAEPELPPVKGGARLAQIVPFALEEQLASDIETQHFAVGSRGARSGTPVAVVAHDRMQSWLAALTAAGIEANAFYVETNCVPAVADGQVVVVDQHRVYFRRAFETAVFLELEPLSEALQLAISTDVPLPVTLYISEAEYQQQQTLLEGLRERVESLQIKLLPEGVLPLFAVQAVARDRNAAASIDLLQGPYGKKTSFSKVLAPWRYAAALTAGLLVLFVIGKGAQLWQLKRTEAQLDQAIAATYTQALPGAKPLPAADARRQFEARLLAAQGAQSSTLLQGLSTLSDALTKAPDTRLDAVSFRTDTLDLRLLAPNVDALDRIRQVAQTHGVSAEIQAASPRDNKIEGRLQFKSQSASRRGA